MSKGTADRVLGCVLGLALGDALGARFQRQRSIQIPDPIPLPSRGTGVTAMARNLVESLTGHSGFDAADVLARHVEWFESGPPAVESFTRRVLARAARDEGVDAARAVWEERGPEVSAGNGSVAYCAPLGAAYSARPSELQDVAPRLSALTHFDERCRTAVLAVTVAVAALVSGESSDKAIEGALGWTADREGGEELEYLIGAVGAERPIDGPDRGFCLFAAAAGLQAVARGDGFAEEVARIVRLGGDTSANAAVAGALVGSRVGDAGLPQEWLDRLDDREAILEEASALSRVTVAKRPPKSYTSSDH